MPKVKQIDHVAVVVQDMEQALLFWRDALGMEMHEIRDVPAEKSQVAFLPLAGSEVELVLPTTEDSGIAKYLAKRGPGMHHICLEVDDPENNSTRLQVIFERNDILPLFIPQHEKSRYFDDISPKYRDILIINHNRYSDASKSHI